MASPIDKTPNRSLILDQIDAATVDEDEIHLAIAHRKRQTQPHDLVDKTRSKRIEDESAFRVNPKTDTSSGNNEQNPEAAPQGVQLREHSDLPLKSRSNAERHIAHYGSIYETAISTIENCLKRLRNLDAPDAFRIPYLVKMIDESADATITPEVAEAIEAAENETNIVIDGLVKQAVDQIGLLVLNQEIDAPKPSNKSENLRYDLAISAVEKCLNGMQTNTANHAADVEVTKSTSSHTETKIEAIVEKTVIKMVGQIEKTVHNFPYIVKENKFVFDSKYVEGIISASGEGAPIYPEADPEATVLFKHPKLHDESP